jgi:hypothetical protein
MEIAVLVFILLIGPLALLYGVDSRRVDDRRHGPDWRRFEPAGPTPARTSVIRPIPGSEPAWEPGPPSR